MGKKGNYVEERGHRFNDGKLQKKIDALNSTGFLCGGYLRQRSCVSSRSGSLPLGHGSRAPSMHANGKQPMLDGTLHLFAIIGVMHRLI